MLLLLMSLDHPQFQTNSMERQGVSASYIIPQLQIDASKLFSRLGNVRQTSLSHTGKAFADVQTSCGS